MSFILKRGNVYFGVPPFNELYSNQPELFIAIQLNESASQARCWAESPAKCLALSA